MTRAVRIGERPVRQLVQQAFAFRLPPGYVAPPPSIPRWLPSPPE